MVTVSPFLGKLTPSPALSDLTSTLYVRARRGRGDNEWARAEPSGEGATERRRQRRSSRATQLPRAAHARPTSLARTARKEESESTWPHCTGGHGQVYWPGWAERVRAGGSLLCRWGREEGAYPMLAIELWNPRTAGTERASDERAIENMVEGCGGWLTNRLVGGKAQLWR